MHTFELQQRINRFFAGVETFHDFTDPLITLAKSAEGMEANLVGVAEGGASVNQWAHQIHSYLTNVQNTTSKFNQRKFFKSLEHFNSAINQLQLTDTTESGFITNLSSEVEKFATIYETFISVQSSGNALPLILAAKVLTAKIEVFYETLRLVEESIGTYDLPANSESSLTLLLPSHLNLVDFAGKLIAIQNLYTELCMLLSVSESTHPLRISKIESGSLWTKVFGDSRVIGMITSFMEQTASWLFRTYTTDGKISSVPRKVEAIEALLGLSTKLAEAGVDTSVMKEHIGKSAISISKNLTEILDGQSSIMINEETISVGSEINKGLLGRTLPLQLKAPDEVIDIDPDSNQPSDS